MRDRVTADKAHVTSKAQQLREAASVARQGASDISAALRKVMYAVEDAQKRRFKVDEDLSVFDTRNCPSAPQRAARRAQAPEISQRAGELSALDSEVATNVAAAAGDVGATTFPGHVQAVDYHDPTKGVDPPPSPAPPGKEWHYYSTGNGRWWSARIYRHYGWRGYRYR